jgi:signal transduction histidine kinase
MRAPLRAVHSFCELLLQGLADKLDPRQEELFHRIMNSTRRLDYLIQDVLTYGKISRAPLDLDPIDLNDLVGEVLRDYPQLQASNAVIEIQSPLLPVRGHPAFLTQCLSNLLSNAVKFVNPGQKAHVRVWTEAVAPDVRVWVEDSGIGISKEYQTKVFGIFQRYHDSTLYEGTGIGLAIVQKAVERMGGRVGVESTPGVGSKFWFQLPAAATTA